MIRYIIFAPLVGAVINWLVGRRVRSERFVGLVACGSVAVSAAFAFWLAFGPEGALRGEEPRVILDHLWTWIQVGGFRADFSFAMDRLSAIYACFITFVGFLIHVFATGYMHGDKGFYRFFAYLNLFMFMMLTLVLADNLLLMFVGWEGVGLCSYLLIGYYTDRKEAGDAAKKAFVVNRIGDWGVVLGIMLVFFLSGSVSFFDKAAAVTGDTAVVSAMAKIAEMPVEPFALGAIFAGGVTSAAVLLFIGATGKSAQIPLYTWLPDAMAGPTPVSALIHAATMVTAGVYMVVRCSAVYSKAPTALFIVAVVGALTAIFAATIGIAQNDIKKVLAYSTVSQLGYMFLACGVGAFVAAIFHVMTHAFFKALLFLGSGSVIHGMHHEQDMRRMGGLKKYMPVTYWTMLTGWLAISGIPIFAGFFSKDEILWKTFSTEVVGVARRGADPVGRRRRDGAPDGHLHDAPDGDDLLGQGALPRGPRGRAGRRGARPRPRREGRSRTTRGSPPRATDRIITPPTASTRTRTTPRMLMRASRARRRTTRTTTRTSTKSTTTAPSSRTSRRG